MSDNKDDGYGEWELIKKWRGRERRSVNKKQSLYPPQHDSIKECKNYFLEDVDELEQKLREILSIHYLTEPQAQRVKGIIHTNIQSMRYTFDLIKSLEQANTD